MQDVKIASAPFLLVRIPSLRIETSGRLEVFEANLKTETELWNLVVKEMWAGRKMADQHKVQQRLTAHHWNNTLSIFKHSTIYQDNTVWAHCAHSQVKFVQW